jgi:hypothetical protein
MAGVLGYALGKQQTQAGPTYRTLEQIFIGVVQGDPVAEARLFIWEQHMRQGVERLEGQLARSRWFRRSKEIRLQRVRENLRQIEAFVERFTAPCQARVVDAYVIDSEEG